MQSSPSHASMAGIDGAGEEDDYMGDLSLFLPADDFSSNKKKFGPKIQAPEASKPKRPKGLSWQEQRRLERERKQREEDERTMAGLEAAIPETNVGFKMLRQMGYSPGSALGKGGAGPAEPVGLEIRRSRAGIGVVSPQEEAAKRQRSAVETKRRREEELMAEFGSRQKTQWRTRRIVGDYRKAEAALAQLENREVVEPPKEEDGDEEKKQEEEEEEEEITEEDLHEILMKLRDEYFYCLYCGCKFESAGALATDCPGPNEEDH